MEIGGPQMKLLTRLLNASSLRGRMIQGNLANENVPGYKRQTVQFEDRLVKAMRSGSGDTSRIEPEVVVDELSPSGPDGNNVNLELEMNAMRENRLSYETYATILESHLRLLETAITEGQR